MNPLPSQSYALARSEVGENVNLWLSNSQAKEIENDQAEAESKRCAKIADKIVAMRIDNFDDAFSLFKENSKNLMQLDYGKHFHVIRGSRNSASGKQFFDIALDNKRNLELVSIFEDADLARDDIFRAAIARDFNIDIDSSVLSEDGKLDAYSERAGILISQIRNESPNDYAVDEHGKDYSLLFMKIKQYIDIVSKRGKSRNSSGSGMSDYELYVKVVSVLVSVYGDGFGTETKFRKEEYKYLSELLISSIGSCSGRKHAMLEIKGNLLILYSHFMLGMQDKAKEVLSRIESLRSIFERCGEPNPKGWGDLDKVILKSSRMLN